MQYIFKTKNRSLGVSTLNWIYIPFSSNLNGLIYLLAVFFSFPFTSSLSHQGFLSILVTLSLLTFFTTNPRKWTPRWHHFNACLSPRHQILLHLKISLLTIHPFVLADEDHHVLDRSPSLLYGQPIAERKSTASIISYKTESLI